MFHTLFNTYATKNEQRQLPPTMDTTNTTTK